jgi:predicted DCC family thiol-disulfide oxidoreductase YuxK
MAEDGAIGGGAAGDGAIILFDAECGLCSANAQFILRHDRAARYRLASMQGETGAALFRRHGIDPADPDTLLLIEGDRVWRDSDAVIAIYAGLGGPWRLAGVARLVPASCATGPIAGSRATAIACSDGAEAAGPPVPNIATGYCDHRLRRRDHARRKLIGATS